MCGLIYKHSLKGRPVNQFILEQYEAQKSRGQEGFGIFDGQEMNLIHEPGEKNIKRWLRRYNSTVIMFHHRNPTSTINVKRACHPFSTKDRYGDNQYILIHNGHISNSEDLFDAHTQKGIEYQSLLQDWSFNDSESLLWDFAEYMEGNQTELKAEGGIAFICVKLVKGELDSLYFGRNVNPLKLYKNKKGLQLSSEGHGEMVTAHTLYTYSYATNQLAEKLVHIPTYSYRPATKPYVPSAWENNNYSQWYGYDNDTDDDKYSLPAKVEPKEEPKEAPDWLPGDVAEKFGLTRKVVEFEADPETQTMKEVLHTVQPDEDVLNTCMRFLIQADGNFEAAYWRMEAYNTKVEKEKDSIEREAKLHLIKKSIIFLQDDPEYEDHLSISSLWRDVCQTQLQTA